MKKLLWLLPIVVAAVAMAQTNGVVRTNPTASSGTATAVTSKRATDHAFGISSDHGFFDEKTLGIVGYGHVVVTNAQLNLTCERLTAFFPSGGGDGHPTNAVAETNVDITSMDNKGETHHLTCDKAIYTYGVANGITNELYTFTGHCLDTVHGRTVTGEPMIWDNIQQTLDIKHFVMMGTNASGFNMNLQK